MRLIKDTPMEVAWRTWRARPEAPTLTVVAKATFKLVATGPCPLAEEQRLPTGEIFYEDDIEQSIRTPDDLVPIKARGECMLIGSVRPPNGEPATSLRISFMIGPVGRQLRVHGDRHWTATGASPALPFEEMPLRWERCFGGPGFEHNPIGRGLQPELAQGQERLMLPNIEDVRAPVRTRMDRPPPAGTGPIPITWPTRIRHAGTYDARWERERWPGYAEDMSWEIFNAAPPDLRVQGFLRGDERIQVYGCHPELPRIDCHLPALLPRAFLREQGRPGMRDVGLRLDTLVVDLDALEARCVWRGVVEVGSDDLEEVDHLFVIHHPLAEPRAAGAYEAWFQSALKKADQAEQESPEEPPEELAAEATKVFHSGVWEIESEKRTRGWREALAAQSGEWPGSPSGSFRLDEGDPEGRPHPDLGPAQKKEALAARWAHLSAAWQEGTTFARTSPALSSSHLLTEAKREELEASLLAEQEASERAMARREEVVEAITAAAGEPLSLAGRDLRGADLSGLALENIDLSGALLTGADLSRASLREVSLVGAELRECELSFARLYASDLTDADLSGSRMEELQMVGCTLLRADLSGGYLAGARLIQCTGAHLDLSDSVLIEAQVNDCALPEARLYQAIFDAARFLRSDLRALRMEGGASAVGAIFDGCQLQGLRASEGADLRRASLRGVQAEEASFNEARMKQADLSGAQLGRAELDDADLSQAKLDGAVMRGASLDRACLQGATIRRADLFQARLEGADLRLADLRHSSLFQAELLEARLQGAELEGADLFGTRLREGTR